MLWGASIRCIAVLKASVYWLVAIEASAGSGMKHFVVCPAHELIGICVIRYSEVFEASP